MSDLVLYTTDNGRTRLDLRVEDGTVWLTQLEIADLFLTNKQNVSIHTKNIFEDGELSREATVKESLTVQTEGNREVQRSIQLYNLGRLVVIFLEQAELRAKDRQQLTLGYWRQNVDRLLEFNERPVLDGRGSLSADEMKAIARQRYESFDQNRRHTEALEADAEDLKTLEAIEKKAKRKGGGK